MTSKTDFFCNTVVMELQIVLVLYMLIATLSSSYILVLRSPYSLFKHFCADPVKSLFLQSVS